MKRNKSSQKHAQSAQITEHIECNFSNTKQDDDKHSEWNNKCRVCLDTGTVPIFGNDASADISNDVETFGSIQIRRDDHLPKYICESCEKLLQAAVLFRKTAKDSDLYLKSTPLTEKHLDNSNNMDDTLDSVKLEVEIDNEHSGHIGTENSLVDIKEEIIVEPSCFFEDGLYNNDTFNDTTTEENINSQNLLLIERSAVSFLKKNKDYNCITCDINFETPEEYSQHKKSTEHKKARLSNKIECEICFKNISRAYYSRHMEGHTNDSKDDKLQCPICNKSYSKTYFNYHLTHTHNKDSKKTQSERIECPVCNKSYEKQYYKFHLAIHYNDSSKYVCDTCGKSFIQQSAFKRHRLIHDDELAYKCTLCPYRGRHPGLLKTHMQTHTRDYQHRCMECPAKFLTKSNLNKHLQRHKGPVDFKCETCKRGFYSKLELERHYEADHMGVKNHVCNFCGKAFGYRNAMMSHQLKVHKREKLTNGKGRLPLYLEVDKKNAE